MKKIISLILCIATILGTLSLCSCGILEDVPGVHVGGLDLGPDAEYGDVIKDEFEDEFENELEDAFEGFAGVGNGQSVFGFIADSAENIGDFFTQVGGTAVLIIFGLMAITGQKPNDEIQSGGILAEKKFSKNGVSFKLPRNYLNISGVFELFGGLDGETHKVFTKISTQESVAVGFVECEPEDLGTYHENEVSRLMNEYSDGENFKLEKNGTDATITFDINSPMQYGKTLYITAIYRSVQRGAKTYSVVIMVMEYNNDRAVASRVLDTLKTRDNKLVVKVKLVG